ncbi:MAG: hypothetical protein HeimC3_53470 [Candidatus Heimdallarchaeota archaeon LC_3]|nr:MAG: hypothetical protein HeimC3_53470 [Candidatus Heimdallarchaeota archaeon LC_3]
MKLPNVGNDPEFFKSVTELNLIQSIILSLMTLK